MRFAGKRFFFNAIIFGAFTFGWVYSSETLLAGNCLRFISSASFVSAFDDLSVGITTSRPEQHLGDWDRSEVWTPFKVSIQAFCQSHRPCLELMDVLFRDRKARHAGKESFRQSLRLWVKKNIPKYKIAYEDEFIPVLNQLLKPYGEQVHGFEIGKDGQGALPDFHYHLMVSHKILPVGNHHDVLGHFILFSMPEVRELTENISRTFIQTLWSWKTMLASDLPASEKARLNSVYQWVYRLLTTSWNLAQEKMYVQNSNGLSLVGAFNTVYNTSLSDRLPLEKFSSTAAAMGIFSTSPQRSILVHPQDTTKLVVLPLGPLSETRLLEAQAAYEKLWTEFGNAGSSADTERLVKHYEAIVRRTLFADNPEIRIGTWKLRNQKRKPFRQRWDLYSREILSDPLFSKLFQLPTLLNLARAQLEIAQTATLELEKLAALRPH